MANIPDKVLKEIQEEAKGIDYGKITIVINKTVKTEDVIYEKRKRYEKTTRDNNFRNG